MTVEKIETWTIDAMRRWTTDYFRRAGIETPQLDADILLAHALGVERIQLLINGPQVLEPQTLATFKQYVIRRAKQREPIAYILGKREFWSLPLAVTPATLIPRPDTECLVEAVLDAIRRMQAKPGDGNDASNTVTSTVLPDDRMREYLQIWAEQDQAQADAQAQQNEDETDETTAASDFPQDEAIASRDINDDILSEETSDAQSSQLPVQTPAKVSLAPDALKILNTRI